MQKACGDHDNIAQNIFSAAITWIFTGVMFFSQVEIMFYSQQSLRAPKGSYVLAVVRLRDMAIKDFW